MNIIKILNIVGCWFALSALMVLLLLFISPLAGAAFALIVLAFILVFLGSPIHVFLSYKKPDWSNVSCFCCTLLIIIFGFIFLAASNVFNFT